MKRTLLTVLLIVLGVAVLAAVLILLGLTQDIKLPDFGPVQTWDDPIFPSTGQETDQTGEPVTQTPHTTTPPTEEPDTLEPPVPPPYEIPEAFRDFAVLDGDKVIMTVGGYRVTFPTTYRLTDVGGVPSLIAPDGSSAKVGYSRPPKDVDALKGDRNYIPDIIRSMLEPVASAKLVSSTDMVVAPLYGTRVGMFSFTVDLLGNELDYHYHLFSDTERFYTITLSLLSGTEYNFNDVMESLERVEEETEPSTSRPQPPPPVTQPPVETEPPGVILPPDEFDQPDDPDEPDDYEIPDAFRDSAVLEGDTVHLTFGEYRVSFPTTYQLVDLGDGMPGLRAPDGSIATVSAVNGDGNVDEITGDEAAAMMADAVISQGGKNLINPVGPLTMDLPGTDIYAALSTCNYEKDGKAMDLNYVVFYENGMKYELGLHQVSGTVYTFMDVVGSVEKIG